MSRKMVRVGEWTNTLGEEQRSLLRELYARGYSTIEAPAHGNYTGSLPAWTLPDEVERQMLDMGLNTVGLRILRKGSNYPNEEGPIQKKAKKGRINSDSRW